VYIYICMIVVLGVKPFKEEGVHVLHTARECYCLESRTERKREWQCLVCGYSTRTEWPGSYQTLQRNPSSRKIPNILVQPPHPVLDQGFWSTSRATRSFVHTLSLKSDSPNSAGLATMTQTAQTSSSFTVLTPLHISYPSPETFRTLRTSICTTSSLKIALSFRFVTPLRYTKTRPSSLLVMDIRVTTVWI